MRQRGVECDRVLLAVGNPAVVLSPSHFGCVGMKVRADDMVMRLNLCATQAGEEVLRQVGAGAVSPDSTRQESKMLIDDDDPASEDRFKSRRDPPLASAQVYAPPRAPRSPFVLVGANPVEITDHLIDRALRV